MLLDHNGVDAFGVSESEETKASRAAGCGVTHNSTFTDFAELCEVSFERICFDYEYADAKRTRQERRAHDVAKV